jgi:flagellar motor switch protein FliM
MVAALVDTNAMLHELAPPAAGNYRHCVHEICKTDNTYRQKEMALKLDEVSSLNEALVSIEVQAGWEVLSRRIFLCYKELSSIRKARSSDIYLVIQYYIQ